MKRHIVVGYFAASVVAMALSNWALHPSTASAFSFLLWIALGPIGIIGLATLDVADAIWLIKNVLYYFAATAGLAACLWFTHGKEGRRRRIGKVAIILIWLAGSAHVLEFLSWAA